MPRTRESCIPLRVTTLREPSLWYLVAFVVVGKGVRKECAVVWLLLGMLSLLLLAASVRCMGWLDVYLIILPRHVTILNHISTTDFASKWQIVIVDLFFNLFLSPLRGSLKLLRNALYIHKVMIDAGFEMLFDCQYLIR